MHRMRLDAGTCLEHMTKNPDSFKTCERGAPLERADLSEA